ncbi:sulfite exporter TauE/SafE family protein [Methylocystis sp. H4A]|uniref:urease accessory protein UreH domain-containing protein n=1 Tax=Methylocystis sp. H4A TaxID=2785788 RepID=UPI0018C20460|nr:sulfite exporter TauE/SafE family protein [Methylocystis sp. H4A]MBG0801539.1 sulfite exporter TauE/SafE family protein [Methylocystis sp. H4A]MBG0801963.1 sulfite exporter TauE/SafE family protein [Methylocystis sp. H4A]
MNETAITFHARGMHCHGCEHVIEAAVRKLAGVRGVSASYPTETVVVDYDADATNFSAIRNSVEQNGYRVVLTEEAQRRRSPFIRLAIIVAALAGLAALILFDTRWISAAGEPDIAQHMSLGLLFLLGLLTGFHCVGMCGAFVVSYATADARAGRSSFVSHLSYGAGKTLSYTAIGAAFGWLGAFIAFTPMLRGVAGVAAGAFLLIFGLNMLGLFAPLRRFRFGLPGPLQNWVNREAGGARHRPFVIGLLNGLMIACGPLQAMYVMAAGTGSPVEGAKTLFVFGVGTLPVMLAFGALTTVLSGAVTHRLLTASGVIVVALGAVMINRGLILTGSGADLASLTTSWRSPAPVERVQPQQDSAAPKTQTIEMEANGLGFTPTRFTLLRGVPVKWVINATQVTTCNNRILVPSLKLEFDVKPGRQTIEFTPEKTGVIPWSCWMGMLRGEFVVVDAAPAAPQPSHPVDSAVQGAPQATQSPPASAAVQKTYTVRRGDTLRAIAKRLYGDEKRWRDIAAANPALNRKKLRQGQIITLPADAQP